MISKRYVVARNQIGNTCTALFPILTSIQNNPLIIDALNPRPAHVPHVANLMQGARDVELCHTALIGFVGEGASSEIEHRVDGGINYRIGRDSNICNTVFYWC